MADALKAEGNKLFAEKKYQESIEKFSQAIELDSSNHVLYSNRSGSYASLKQYKEALQDAEKVTELKSDWPKGWSRKGAALHGTGDLVGATDAFEQALKLDPNNAQAKSGLDSVARAIKAEAQADGMGGNPFGDMFGGDLKQKLENNPKTRGFTSDPEFMEKLNRLQTDPNAIGSMLQGGDPRLLQAMSVLLGIDMQMGGPPGGASDPTGRATEVEEDVPMPDARPSQQKKAPEPEPEPEPEDEDAIADREAKVKADAEKALGTENYKKRKFDEAISHYEQAWEIRKDIVYLTNLAAAKFEKGDYQGAIEACQKAIEYGREVFADFKVVAKAFGRMGSAYEKLGDFANAIEYYQRSLTEHRTPEILTKLRAAEKAKIKAEKEAYLDPAKADEARELGNAKFKAQEYPAAVEAYSESIKRAPTDPRGYTNRANAFMKLLTLPAALDDANMAIKVDPTFTRGYLRKAQVYHLMRQYFRCVDACDEATSIDKDRKDTREIQRVRAAALDALVDARAGETREKTIERVQGLEEVQNLLSEPGMRAILEQANSNPSALMNHVSQNPMIRSNVQKLMAAGVLQFSTGGGGEASWRMLEMV